MSSNIQFAGPFIKKMFFGTAGDGRRTGNPVLSQDYEETVSVPNRRVYLFIQNQGTNEATILFDEDGDNLGTDIGIKLFAGQSISFDNFNAGFRITCETPNSIVIGEAFA